ncbi:hypothetical protein L1987_65088 [Smallanthus sonchifolius]|uniref:Uncharacterized protein n=1 Tax=Smallanthus sonchifolius TaxID=185202 RepID=A0ACB9BTQ7_9ASTR|nr:hypothetical protein L1987_65088 [Smallanthus sonchifolius]
MCPDLHMQLPKFGRFWEICARWLEEDHASCLLLRVTVVMEHNKVKRPSDLCWRQLITQLALCNPWHRGRRYICTEMMRQRYKISLESSMVF